MRGKTKSQALQLTKEAKISIVEGFLLALNQTNPLYFQILRDISPDTVANELHPGLLEEQNVSKYEAAAQRHLAI